MITYDATSHDRASIKVTFGFTDRCLSYSFVSTHWHRSNCNFRFYWPAQVQSCICPVGIQFKLWTCIILFLFIHFILGWEYHKDCCVQANISETGIQKQYSVTKLHHAFHDKDFIYSGMNQPTSSNHVIRWCSWTRNCSCRCSPGSMSSRRLVQSRLYVSAMSDLIWQKYFHMLGHPQIQCTPQNVPTFRVCFLFSCGKCY